MVKSARLQPMSGIFCFACVCSLTCVLMCLETHPRHTVLIAVLLSSNSLDKCVCGVLAGGHHTLSFACMNDDDVMIALLAPISPRLAADHGCMCWYVAVVQVEDVMFLLRKDSRKFARVRELLHARDAIRQAREAFKEDDLEAAPAPEEGTQPAD